MLIAITRGVSPAISRCELTHFSRQTIDHGIAAAQHKHYERCLAELGCDVRRLPAEPDLPDSVFVEDPAIVLDELAILTRPGAESRREETASIAAALEPWRRLERIQPPATLDGGDVLRIGRRIYAGLSSRTTGDGIDQLESLLEPHGYEVVPVEVTAALHLKTAVTCIGERAVLINRRLLDPAPFGSLDQIEVDPAEPWGANALLVGSRVMYSSSFPLTAQRMEAQGVKLRLVATSELNKAEGGLTCCSLLFEDKARA